MVCIAFSIEYVIDDNDEFIRFEGTLTSLTSSLTI
jgi:hypothetical protein